MTCFCAGGGGAGRAGSKLQKTAKEALTLLNLLSGEQGVYDCKPAITSRALEKCDALVFVWSFRVSWAVRDCSCTLGDCGVQTLRPPARRRLSACAAGGRGCGVQPGRRLCAAQAGRRVVRPALRQAEQRTGGGGRRCREGGLAGLRL